jgi:hypothetical protein
MEQVWQTVADHWEVVTAILSWLALSILNFLTQHPEYVQGTRARRWLSVAVSVFAFLKSKGNPGLFKLPMLPEKNGAGPKPPDKTRPPTSGVIGVLLLAFCLTGCGTSVLQKISATGQGFDRAWTRFGKPWGGQCKVEATACRKEGVKLEFADCPRAQACVTGLEHFSAALDTGDRAIITGTPLAVKDDPQAADYLLTAVTAYDQAMKAWKTWEALLKKPSKPATPGGK